MRYKCTQCGKATKNLPCRNIDKKPAKGWHWSTLGLMCESCYNKSLESLVSKNENPTFDNGYYGVRSKER